MTNRKNARATDADHLGNSYSPDLHGRRDRSVFAVDVHWRRGTTPLPGMLVTEVTAESREIENTELVYDTPHGGRYPILNFPDESPQPLGHVAHSFGQGYYYEGLSTAAAENLGKRIDCFRAAELLFLHGVAHGNVRSHVGLGKIYTCDHAEGHYFDALNNNLFADLTLPEAEVKRKAHDHLKHAAAHDDVEGTYLFGDAIRAGVGCAPDKPGAFPFYQKAWQMAQSMDRLSKPYLGNIAWRLGRAYEEGEGCTCDYDIALQWYEKAILNLHETVIDGMWFYDLELAGATNGAKRMRQEIALRDYFES